MKRAAALLFLAGCKGCADDPVVGSDLTAIAADPTGVFAGESLGAGAAVVPVFATNAAGAPVPSSDFTVDGGADFVMDGLGWGQVTLDASGAVGVTGGGATAEGYGWVTSTPMQGFELPAIAVPGGASAPSDVALAGRGVAWVSGATVYWSAPGGTPVPVATLPSEDGRILAVQADQDGVTDLVAWAGDTALVLRGRDGGGLTFGAGWTAVADMVGATVQDLDGDGVADVQVAITDGVGTKVVWMLGDGTGWAQADSVYVDYVALGISAEDYSGDGEAEVTLLTEDGLIRRYARYDEGWQTGSSTDLDVGMGPGTRVYPSADLTEDGSADLIFAGPLSDGSGAQVKVVTAGAASLLSYAFLGTYSDGTQPSDVRIGVGDLTGDGVPDVSVLSVLGLQRVSWNPSLVDAEGNPAPNFESANAGSFPLGHGLAVGDLTGDGVHDIVVAAPDALITVTGVRLDDDPTSPYIESWKAQPTGFSLYNLHIAGEPVFVDLNGDGGTDLLSFTQADTGLALQSYRSYPQTDAVPGWALSGATVLATTAEPLALEVCDGVAWALTDEADGVVLRAYALNSAGVAATRLGEWPASGASVLCGPFAASGSAPAADVAVVDADAGGVALFTATGPVATIDAPGLSVAAADTDGDGLRELIGLDANAAVAVGRFGGGAAESVVSLADTELAVTDPRTVAVGALSVSDADGDGVPDVVLQQDGVVRVYRVQDGLLTAPEAFYTTRPVGGRRVYFGEVDADDTPDLLAVGVDDDPDDGTDWDGVLLYSAL